MEACTSCYDDFYLLDDRVKVRIFSTIAGILFAFGWWIFIDAVSFVGVNNDPMPVPAQLYLPGVGSTLSFFILSLMDFEALDADEYTYHGGVMVKYQAWGVLSFAIALSLTCVAISIWVLSDIYSKKKGINGNIPDDIYPGVAIFMQCTLLFFATIAMRLGRYNDE
mmetsp:Transcript_13313/g.15415  ORF Transcript_13313/g.15415 Transcript_13313/m.15415 type:complete len:166 (-) Transcript_13313:648-1145(-)